MTTTKKPTYTSTQQLPAFGFSVGSYVAKSQMLTSLTEKIQPLLSPPYRGLCKVANIREKILVLQVLQPAFATRLQYELVPLKNKMREVGLDINEIQLLIQPEVILPAPRQRAVIPPSKLAGRALRAAIPSIDDPELRNALATLAKNLDKV